MKLAACYRNKVENQEENRSGMKRRRSILLPVPLWVYINVACTWLFLFD
jgi:hypothetical protein